MTGIPVVASPDPEGETVVLGLVDVLTVALPWRVRIRTITPTPSSSANAGARSAIRNLDGLIGAICEIDLVVGSEPVLITARSKSPAGFMSMSDLAPASSSKIRRVKAELDSGPGSAEAAIGIFEVPTGALAIVDRGCATPSTAASSATSAEARSKRSRGALAVAFANQLSNAAGNATPRRAARTVGNSDGPAITSTKKENTAGLEDSS